MSVDFSGMITAFVTLFVLIDPIGLTPIFLALTHGASTAQRRTIALRGVTVAFFVLMVFALIGEKLLRAVGISMAAFRISGGIMLFMIAVEMLFEKRNQRRAQSATGTLERDPTVFPLATPLIAGPGALATMILMASERSGDPLAFSLMLVALAAVLAVLLGFFWMAELFERLAGPVMIQVVTRLLGILLGAMAVQFVLTGLAEVGVVRLS